MTAARKNDLSALDAKCYAQELAFAPFAFQAAIVMRDNGLLQRVADAGATGVRLQTLVEECGLSEYGASVLLDFGENLGLIHKADDRYSLGRVGYFVLNDEMTRVNMDFTQDVCYEALAFLGQSVRDSRPAGLHTLGPWRTIYEGLTRLPGPAGESWFRFDQYYSDRAFDDLLDIVFDTRAMHVMDVGANTGRWALKALQANADVRMTLVDLPAQLAECRRHVENGGFGARVEYVVADMLNGTGRLPADADAIVMSQFLDCFSASEISSILTRIVSVMAERTTLYIVELFPDRQDFEAARFSLDATSLYFTCVANGKSRMYHSAPFIALVEDANLSIERQIDGVGIGHTVLCCRKRPDAQ